MTDKRFTLANRLIHWAIAFTLLFLLLTVFLRLGWMNKDHLGSVLQENLQKSGIKINDSEAATIGKALRKPMWIYHLWSGYLLIGLYLIRAILTAFQGIAFQNPFSKDTATREKFKSWLYIIFYILLAISLFTGFMIVNGPADAKELVEMVHVKSLYYVITFIILHIGGVLIADRRKEKGIVSRMISGEK